MVRTVDIPKYARNMMNNDITMARGIFLCGFLASSPVVATVSKPTKPKKHFAAPAITPATPKGRNPPSPAFGGTLSFGMFQF